MGVPIEIARQTSAIQSLKSLLTSGYWISSSNPGMSTCEMAWSVDWLARVGKVWRDLLLGDNPREPMVRRGD
jgi:hypothetical protein